MFNNLADKLGNIFSKLTNRGVLSEKDVDNVLLEVKTALIEADVSLLVVKNLIANIKKESVGSKVFDSVQPGQMVVKIVHDHLVAVLAGEASESQANNDLIIAKHPPTVILMIGLQGSGKTTTTVKIANFLTNKRHKKVLLSSTDIYRPAAREQLEVLGQAAGIDTLDIIDDEKVLNIAKRAYNKAKLEAYDVLIIDTAGRLHIDNNLMQELKNIAALVNPIEILLVADAMTGQESVNIAQSFNEQINLTGIVLSRIDGDSRGGAALSMRYITNCPIKFLGSGEKYTDLEVFYPDRIAKRILNMGDVVTLVEQAQANLSEKQVNKLTIRMEKGLFNFNDMARYLKQIIKMGGMSNILGMLPGMNKLKNKLESTDLDSNDIERQLVTIGSMTKQERKNYNLINPSRKNRIAKGSGVSIDEVNQLMKQHKKMLISVKKLKKIKSSGMLGQVMENLFK